MARRDNGAGVLGYLLMDPGAHYWYSPPDGLWIAFSVTENGKEVADFLPPAEAFRPDLPTARKDAEKLKEQGIDARPTRVAILCR